MPALSNAFFYCVYQKNVVLLRHKSKISLNSYETSIFNFINCYGLYRV